MDISVRAGAYAPGMLWSPKVPDYPAPYPCRQHRTDITSRVPALRVPPKLRLFGENPGVPLGQHRRGNLKTAMVITLKHVAKRYSPSSSTASVTATISPRCLTDSPPSHHRSAKARTALKIPHEDNQEIL